MKKYFILFVLILVQGCTITQVIEPAEMSKGSELCVIENASVKAGFLQEFKNVLNRKGIPYKVVKEHSSHNVCEWTATYVGKWSWDLALYLSYAEISVYHNGDLDGKAVYDATKGKGNMSKFIDGEEKIQELVEELMQMRSSAFGFIQKFG